MKKIKIIVLTLLFYVENMFSNLSIDVVIPCHKKDQKSLDLVIQGIKKNVTQIRRIIVVSYEKLTNKAEWYDESLYPFSKYDLALAIFNGNHKKATNFLYNERAMGWIYQQFLKLYAPLIIPNISENVLIVDADTIFLKKVTFIDENGYALYNYGRGRHKIYFEHGARLLPGFKRIFQKYSGICHHMLFQRHVIKEFFNEIQFNHKCDPWKAICTCIDHKYVSKPCMSEYELYFNYVFSRKYKVKIRELKWINIKLNAREEIYNQSYHYISCHSYLKSIF